MKKKKITLAAVAASLLLSIAVSAPGHAAELSKEYQIKAAMLYQFLQFISWPEMPPAAGVISLCMLGEDPFGATLSPIEKQTLNGAAIEILRGVTILQAKGCHMLFISDSESQQLSRILSELRNDPVLTVSEIGGFADRGGMIGFIFVDNKVKFEINNAAARQAKLRIDAQVLELAKRVIDK